MIFYDDQISLLCHYPNCEKYPDQGWVAVFFYPPTQDGMRQAKVRKEIWEGHGCTMRIDGRVIATDTMTLASGETVAQTLIDGVAAISHTARQIASKAHTKAARRGMAPPPAGGLFDETARNQLNLF